MNSLERHYYIFTSRLPQSIRWITANLRNSVARCDPEGACRGKQARNSRGGGTKAAPSARRWLPELRPGTDGC
jgi:hypothetical protein